MTRQSPAAQLAVESVVVPAKSKTSLEECGPLDPPPMLPVVELNSC